MQLNAFSRKQWPNRGEGGEGFPGERSFAEDGATAWPFVFCGLHGEGSRR